MEGRAFLESAKRLIGSTAEEDWRTAAGRAYYALMLEGREVLHRWGFVAPNNDKVHSYVRLRFVYATDPDLKTIGYLLEDLTKLRNAADYKLNTLGPFASLSPTRQAILDSSAGIVKLAGIDADPVRRAAAIAAIRP
jgi:hypothetical protein